MRTAFALVMLVMQTASLRFAYNDETPDQMSLLPNALATVLTTQDQASFTMEPVMGYNQTKAHNTKEKRTQDTLDRFFNALENRGWTFGDDAMFKLPQTILSFGCSFGVEPTYLVSRFPKAKVYGFDISKNIIKIAERETEGSHIEYTADSRDLPYGKVDLLTVNFVLMSAMSHDDFAESMKYWRSLLSQKGILELGGIYTGAFHKDNSGIDFDPNLVLDFLKDQPTTTYQVIENNVHRLQIAWVPNLAVESRLMSQS